jgi:hypothetical protein
MMGAVSLLTPILNGGIQNINFVNGRVLTAEDMTAERTAAIQRQRLLASAVGDGVATGLEVTLSASSVAYGQQVVHITAGVAFNRNGDTLQLASDTDVTLTATLPAASSANGGLFAPCQPPQTQLTNPGIYVLTILPASGFQGQAPVTLLNSAGVATSCSSRYKTAGVQFRLSLVTLASTGTGLQPALFALANNIQTQLNSGATQASLAATLAPLLSQLRNGLAHACFGTEALAGFAVNPFAGQPQASSLASYGLIDDQRTAGLITDCEVPLALAYWSQQGIQFLDMWSVRRPIVPQSASGEWPLFSGRRRSAEGLAMFLQFQDQLANLPSTLGTAALNSVSATSYFYYLTPAGILPIGNLNPSAGFDYLEFFNNRTYRKPVFIEGARIDRLFHSAFFFPPIDLSKKELLWVYQVHENQDPADSSAGSSLAPVYMVFTNGQIGFQGEAKYDLNYFNYANFA